MYSPTLSLTLALDVIGLSKTQPGRFTNLAEAIKYLFGVCGS